MGIFLFVSFVYVINAMFYPNQILTGYLLEMLQYIYKDILAHIFQARAKPQKRLK